MSIITKLRATLGLSGGAAPRQVYETQVRCRRCGEELTAQVNLLNDLSMDYQRNVFTARKLVSGSGANRCFQTIEIRLTFNQNRKLIEREITGGEFVDESDPATAGSD